MSYIAEIASSTLATREAGCTLYTYGDFIFAAFPFLLQGFAH
jgi:hypothetical protein